MKELLVDTSAWMALVDAGDVNHWVAVEFQDQIAGTCRLIASNYILDELYTLVLMDLGYQTTVEIKQKLDQLRAGRILDAVWVDENLSDEAWTVFERFNRDKTWSFTDCVSYSVMNRRKVQEAFTFDHHFEQRLLGRIRG